MKAWQRLIRERFQEQEKDKIPEIEIDIKKAVCKEITYEQASTIIIPYEWLGTMGTTKYHYGIFYDDILAGAICFGWFQAPVGYKNYVGEKYAKQGLQLSRGACVWWAHNHSASKLIGFGLREITKKDFKFCIAFSDEDAGEIGTVYQATNWLYLGKRTDKIQDYKIIYKDTKKTFCDTRDLTRKLGFRGIKKAEEYIKINPNLAIVLIKPKARYIKLLGNKKENNEMLQILSPKLLPYPKREY